MQREPDGEHPFSSLPGTADAPFAATDGACAASCDLTIAASGPAGAKLEAKAHKLLRLARWREEHFRHPIMADGAMGVMLSLFMAELGAIPLSESTLALTNILDDGEAHRLIESLIHAGLVVVNGESLERQTVGLTPLGSARMRSFVNDHPDI